MKALTIRQPYASLIAIGAKKIETRPCKFSYRGKLVIHAGLRNSLIEPLYNRILMGNVEPDSFTYHYLMAMDAAGDRAVAVDEFQLGEALGTIDLVDCIPTERLTDISAQERAFGDYSPGRYGLILENFVPFPRGICVRGQQGLWNFDETHLIQQAIG